MIEAADVPHERGAGPPPPSFMSPLSDARAWADMACRDELRAYCLAAFEGMDQGDQARFLDHVTGRAAA